MIKQVVASYALQTLVIRAIPSEDFKDGRPTTPKNVSDFIKIIDGNIPPSPEIVLSELVNLEKSGYCKQVGKSMGSFTEFLLE